MNRQAIPKNTCDTYEPSDGETTFLIVPSLPFTLRPSPLTEALVHSPQSPVHPPIQLNDETDSPAIVVDPPSPIRKNSDASRPVVTQWDWNQTCFRTEPASMGFSIWNWIGFRDYKL